MTTTVSNVPSVKGEAFKQEPVRILHVYSGNLYGGIETFLHTLAQARRGRARHDGVCALLRGPPGDRASRGRREAAYPRRGARPLSPEHRGRARAARRDPAKGAVRSRRLPFGVAARSLCSGGARARGPSRLPHARRAERSRLARSMGEPDTAGPRALQQRVHGGERSLVLSGQPAGGRATPGRPGSTRDEAGQGTGARKARRSSRRHRDPAGESNAGVERAQASHRRAERAAKQPSMGLLDRRRRPAAQRAGLRTRSAVEGEATRPRRTDPVPGSADRRPRAHERGRCLLSAQPRPRALRDRVRRGPRGVALPSSRRPWAVLPEIVDASCGRLVPPEARAVAAALARSSTTTRDATGCPGRAGAGAELCEPGERVVALAGELSGLAERGRVPDVRARALCSGGQSGDAILSTVASALRERGDRFDVVVDLGCGRGDCAAASKGCTTSTSAATSSPTKHSRIPAPSAFARSISTGRRIRSTAPRRRRWSPSRPSSTSRTRAFSCARWRASRDPAAASSSRPQSAQPHQQAPPAGQRTSSSRSRRPRASIRPTSRPWSKKNLWRIARECGLVDIHFRYTNRGRIPFTAASWPSRLGARGRWFSDNVVMVATRP